MAGKVSVIIIIPENLVKDLQIAKI